MTLKTKEFRPFIARLLALFFILVIIFIPFAWDLQTQITHFLFEKPVSFITHQFFQQSINYIDFSSDTIGLNLLICLLFFISFCVTLLLSFFSNKSTLIIITSRLLITYFLAFVLIKYGIDKVFKAQFYLPEPNILYSNFGNLSKDILFWSTIGTSRFYNITIGCIEILIGLLLIVSKTRTIGLLFTILSFLNILIINLGFDISVKTFTMLLILMAIFTVYPNLKQIWIFLTHQKNASLSVIEVHFFKSKKLELAIKILTTCFLLGSIFLPYYQTNNYNDDEQKRPFLHGAYEITQMIVNNDTLKPIDFTYKKIFIHRKSFLIFQKKNDEMEDFYLKIDSSKRQIELFDYNKKATIIDYRYTETDSVLTLKLRTNQLNLITAKALDWRKLPALKNEFHFNIDQIH